MKDYAGWIIVSLVIINLSLLATLTYTIKIAFDNVTMIGSLNQVGTISELGKAIKCRP